MTDAENPDEEHPDAGTLIDEARVETLAGYGLSAADIAEVLGIDRAYLEKRCRRALAGGPIKANARVAESLYRKATGEGREGVTAAIFWLKTRARWKEVSVHELGGVPGRPLEQVTRIRLVGVQAHDDYKKARDERVRQYIDAQGGEQEVVCLGAGRS